MVKDDYDGDETAKWKRDGFLLLRRAIEACTDKVTILDPIKKQMTPVSIGKKKKHGKLCSGKISQNSETIHKVANSRDGKSM